MTSTAQTYFQQVIDVDGSGQTEEFAGQLIRTEYSNGAVQITQQIPGQLDLIVERFVQR